MAIITAEDYFIEGCKNLSVKHQKYPPFYQNSKGDDFKAKELFEKSANLGYAPAMRELGRCYIEGYGIWIKNKLAKGHALLCKAIFAGDKDALKYYWEKEFEYSFSDIKDGDAVQNHREVQRLLQKKEEEEEAARKAKAKAKRQAKKEAERKKQEEVESKAKEIELSKQNKKSKSEVHEKEELDTDIVALFEESESANKSNKENKTQSKPTKKSATTTAKKTKSMSESDDEDIDRIIDAIFEDKVEEVSDNTTKSKSKSSSQSQVKGSVKAKQSKKEVLREATEEKDLKDSSEIERLGDCYVIGKTVEKNIARAVSLYQKAAEMGNSDAMVKLGNCYYRGDGVDKNYELSVIWYQRAIELGNKYAMCNLGLCYFNKTGIKGSGYNATYWIDLSIEHVDANVLSYLYKRTNSKDWYYKAKAKYRKLAEKDDLDAILWLAEHTASENRSESTQWYLKAVKLGDTRAMVALGDSSNCQNEIKSAIKWYEEAAKLGDLSAIRSLGYIYLSKDKQKAEYWLKQAAEQNDLNSMCLLHSIYINIIKDDKKADYWSKKLESLRNSKKSNLSNNQPTRKETENYIADIPLFRKKTNEEDIVLQDNEIMYNLAISYNDGIGLALNKERAKYWFLKSAELGNEDAMFEIANCYENGYGTDVNLKEAIKWYEKVKSAQSKECIDKIKASKEWKKLIFDDSEKLAHNGDKNAMCFVGNCYAKGAGCDKNLEMALSWYKQSAESGCIDAMYKLGEFFHKGIGVTVNLKEAVSWYEKVNNKKSQNNIEEIKASKEWKKIVIIDKEKTVDENDDLTMNEIARFYCNKDEFQDFNKCFYWFKRSAELGNKNSQSYLGYCYEFGVGTIVNLREAIRWYETVDSQRTQERISKIKNSKEWQNILIEDIENVAIKGSAEDVWLLGMKFLYGMDGLPKNIKKAAQWFNKSAQMGCNTASSFMSLKNPVFDLANVVSPSYEPTNCEINAPIGHLNNGEIVDFNLDINKGHHHAFVIGETGSGKSRFLHDIIISMISKYSSEDIELYLLDFKGVEFNPYRDIKHSRVVLVDRADERITYEVIYELKEKMQERQKLLASAGASDVYEYNHSDNGRHLSQIILAVDECQTLFTDRSLNSRLQNEMVDIIALIAQQGRAYGVHLLMATQSLTNAKQLGNEILNQIGEHYILPCIPADAARLVPEHERRETESVVANMKKGKGQCYYQGANGQFLFTFNYIEKGESQTTLINLAKTKAERYKSNGQIYFSGSLQFSLTTEIVEWLSSKGRDNLVASPGQSINLKQEPLSLVLRNDMSENVMLLGLNDKHYITHTAINILTSLIAVSEKKNVACKFYVFDCYDDDEADYFNTLDSLAQTGKCNIVSKRNRMNVLFELCKDIASNQTQEQKVLLILGEENFRELKFNSKLPDDATSPTSSANVLSSSFEDTLAMMNALSNPVVATKVPHEDLSHIKTTGDAVEFILSKGPDCGVFTIMQLDKIDHLYLNNDGYINIKNVYERFKHFIIFRSNEKDVPVLRLPDDIRPERLEDNPERLRAYYYNDGNGKYCLFTPYTSLTPEQIKKLL